jgi:predicted RNA-binding Zn-ribbon protein involved in translation (DUF1610 family)
MMKTLDDTEVELTCSECGYRTTRTAARLRRETAIICPNCGAQIVPPSDERGED